MKVNFGEDSEEDGTYVSVGGPNRFRLMMNFSNLSFFNDYYSKDDDGNAILDSSCGGIAGGEFRHFITDVFKAELDKNNNTCNNEN